MGEVYPPRIHMLKAKPLAPENMTVFGNGAFNKVIGLNEAVKVGPNPI